MAAYNTSSAYDLSAFEEAPKKQLKKAPELQVVRNRSAKRTLAAAFTPKAVAAFAIVVTLICLMVYNHVCLNEITGDINALQEEMQELESQNVIMASQLDSMASMRVVEERAREMGLDRLDKYQTRYVYLYEEDKINLAEEPPESESPTGVAKVARSLFDGLMEYIGEA